MKSFTLALGTVLIVMVLGFPVSIFGCYVLVDVSNLYKLPLLSELTLVQFYGVSVVTSLLFGSFKHNKEDDTNELSEAITRLIQRAFIVLIGWGIAHLFYLVMA